nr:urea transporter [Streptomyces sp. SID5468]
MRRAAIPRFPFAVRVLRGQAQVTFLPSAVTGAFFSAALFTAGWVPGLYALLGTAVGTATARALGVGRDRLDAGLEGFNACLVAAGCAVLLDGTRPVTAVVAAFGAVVVTVVTAALRTVLAGRGIPTFTTPFCAVATVIALAAPGAHHPAVPPAGPATATFTELWHAFFANVGQIFFLPRWYAGALCLAGIWWADRRAGAAACLGSLTAIGTARLLGSPAAAVGQGLLGYNAVLTAMALYGVFLAADRWSLGYAVTGAVAATGLTPAVTAFLAPYGGHAFTWPFVVTATVFTAAAQAFPRLRPR